MTNIFDTHDMAAGYAAARPPIHPRIVSAALGQGGSGRRVRRALDIGCGTGLSTRALDPFASRCIGVEPAISMLAWAHEVAPHATFAAATAEALPLPDGSVDLVTAAGSLNYVRDLDRCFAEVHRVLAAHGCLLVYDFAPGRRFADASALDDWFTRFTARYPYPPGDARPLDPVVLAECARPFESRRSETLAISVPMRLPEYEAYVMTETNVTAALRDGASAPAIAAWVRDTLAPLWGGPTRDVLFEAYWVELQRR